MFVRLYCKRAIWLRHQEELVRDLYPEIVNGKICNLWSKGKVMNLYVVTRIQPTLWKQMFWITKCFETNQMNHCSMIHHLLFLPFTDISLFLLIFGIFIAFILNFPSIKNSKYFSISILLATWVLPIQWYDLRVSHYSLRLLKSLVFPHANLSFLLCYFPVNSNSNV